MGVFTSPLILREQTYKEHGIYRCNDLSIYCNNCCAAWDSSDEFEGYFENLEVNQIVNTNQTEILIGINEEKARKNCKPLKDYEKLEIESIEQWQAGKLCHIDSDGFCPICGGKLEGDIYRS